MSTFLQNRVQASNDLGFHLLSHLAENAAGTNVFISSLSIEIALAMTYIGADGGAQKALATVLGLGDSSLEELNKANKALLARQKSLDPETNLAIANSIWVANGLTLDPGFVERIAEHYRGKVANIDFSDPSSAAKIINGWVAQETREKITDLLTPSVLQDAILVLVNAIYFKGSWTHPFKKRQTSEKIFTLIDGTKKKLPMMTQSGKWRFYENDMFQGIVLPYGDEQASMHIILPRPDIALDAFRKYFTLERWNAWTQKSHRPIKGDISLPRFKARYKKDLVGDLVTLGGQGFIGAGFPGMGIGALRISHVIHEAVLEVNEEGAEAAAATAVLMERSLSMDQFEMIVDRPFFCAIYDQETGAILFMGWILDPE